MCYPGARSWLGAWLFKRTKQVVEKVEAVAERMGLANLLHVAAGTLSHGQKQWLEIGMLLIQEPKLMLLDEPVAGMSAHERERTAELLRDLCAGRAVVVVEHDMDFVARIAHRVTVLHQGKLLAEGPMDAVKNDPQVIEVYLGH
jgi:urea transport system ATP-binding protein